MAVCHFGFGLRHKIKVTVTARSSDFSLLSFIGENSTSPGFITIEKKAYFYLQYSGLNKNEAKFIKTKKIYIYTNDLTITRHCSDTNPIYSYAAHIVRVKPLSWRSFLFFPLFFWL